MNLVRPHNAIVVIDYLDRAYLGLWEIAVQAFNGASPDLALLFPRFTRKRDSFDWH